MGQQLSVIFIKPLLSSKIYSNQVCNRKAAKPSDFFLIFILICGISMQVREILNQKCSNWDHNHCLESFHHSTLSPKISPCMYLVEDVFSVWEATIWLGTWFWGGFFGDVLFFDCNLFNCQFGSIWWILPLHGIILKPEISYFWLTNTKAKQ